MLSKNISSSAKSSQFEKQPRTAVLIVNTHSRKGSRSYLTAKHLLEHSNIELIACYPVKKPRLLNAIITEALALRPQLLIVGSGDGTVSEVVDHLAFRNTVLGLIPLGTTNNFARSTGVPLNLESAIDTIINGRVIDIDLGRVGDDYFANVASIGISVEVAANVPHVLKKYFGRLAYALTGLKIIAKHRAFKATITANGKQRHLRTHQLVIANGSSHGGTAIASDASIDNKRLTIFRIGRAGRWQLIKGLAGFTVGQSKNLTEKGYLVTGEATIETDRTCSVEIDGEIKATTPATFSVAPDALKIMVP